MVTESNGLNTAENLQLQTDTNILQDNETRNSEPVDLPDLREEVEISVLCYRVASDQVEAQMSRSSTVASL